MKKARFLPALFALLSVVLSACGMIPQPTPTATPSPAPSETPLPTVTSTPAPSDTPEPSPTPSTEPTLALGDLTDVDGAGYSFRAPLGYELDIADKQVGVSDKAGRLIISLFGDTTNPQNLSSEEIADSFIEAVFKKADGSYESGEPYTINIGDVEGTAYDINGTLFGASTRGQAVVVMPSEEQYLFGLALANTSQDAEQWEKEGSKVFSALINSVTFSTSKQSGPTGTCKISIEDTYGYSEENPIKVGGGAFDGPPRERAYFDNLLGPNGEQTSYERTGSVPVDDTILDVFVVTVSGKTITLYVDEYAYVELKAPVGFTCAGAFLGAP